MWGLRPPPFKLNKSKMIYQIIPLQEYLKVKGIVGVRAIEGYVIGVDGSLRGIYKTADAVGGAVKRMMGV